MKSVLDAVLLDARQDVASAAAKVIRSGLERVAVRRTEGLVVFWYAFDTEHVLARFRDCDQAASVKQALDLHERTAAPVQDIDRVAAAPVGTNTVILDGPRFIGIRPANAPPDPNIQDLPDMETTPEDQTARETSPEWGVAMERDAVGDAGAGRPPTPPAPRRLALITAPLQRMARRVRTLRADRPAGKTRDGLVGASPERGVPLGASAPSSPPPSPGGSAAFTAYPRLDAPATVPPQGRFTITIGLAPLPQPDTVGGPLTILTPVSVARFTLDLLVVADGFGMPSGSRHRLVVDRSDPYAHPISVPLVAPESVDDTLLTTISVIYFFEGVPCGTASRRIAVIPAGTQPLTETHGVGELWTSANKTGGAVTVMTGVPAIDLTVTISKPDGNSASGQFVWAFQSSHNVALPTLPVRRDLGQDAGEFGTHVIEGIQNSEAQDMVALQIGGLGKDIANRMPAEFWPLLRDVASVVAAATPGRSPTVLFLTAEANVPWELALVKPPLDPGAPPFLGCQTNMARWPLSDSGSPALPPAASVDVHEFAVVVGDYAAQSRWRRLEKAEEEGSTLVSRYGAIRLTALPPQIKQLLNAKLETTGDSTGVEAVHFACHGEAIQGHVLDAAIILGQGQRMIPTWLANAPLGEFYHPFLFLNACQVGKAGELLGSFSGFAGESLKGGFSGFLAPLWSVDDGLACNIALEFYDRVFGSEGLPPAPVASVLRDLRRRFAPDQEKGSASRLAYVFYGHPCLTLHRKKED